MGPKRASFVGVGPLLPALATAQRHSDDDPTDVEVPLGEGRFQRLTLVAATLASIVFLLHVDSFRLTTRIMDHWCRRPTAFSNLTVSEWKSLSSPMEDDASPSQCLVRNPPDGGLKARVVTCDEWEFNLTCCGNNIVSEWSLVCQRERLIDLAVLAYMAACAVSLPLVGFAADRLGRLVVMNVSFVALLVAGFTTSHANSFPLFVFLRIIVSVNANSVMILLSVVLYEVSTPSRRVLYCYFAPATAFTFVSLILFAASHLKHSWQAFHLELMAPTTMLAAAFIVVGESPAWLVASWRLVEAEVVALKAARMNGFAEEECRDWFKRADQRSGARSDEVPGNRNFLAVFAMGVRRRSLLLCYIWGAGTLSFSQLYVNDVFPLLKPVVVTGMLFQVPVYAAAYACTTAFGAQRTVVVLAMAFSSLSWGLAALYDAERVLVCSILVATLRMVGNVIRALLFLLTMQQYPPTMRCTAFSLTYALGQVAWCLVGMPYIYTPRYHRDITMAVVTILMAFVAVAVEHLPPSLDQQRRSRTERSRSSVSRCSSVGVAVDVRRFMQESLVSLPKGPIKTRPNSLRHQDSVPEQFSVRVSKIH